MKYITKKGVIGEFFKALNALDGMAWIMLLSNYFTSDQDVETYPWLGQSPVMREWIGGRHAKGLGENAIEIRNVHFEATIEFLRKHMRRDKTGQLMIRIQDLAQRTNSHWAKLLTLLILAGEATPCYDGQFYFDTDHSEGKSGTQSNDLAIDISELPTSVHGTTTLPSVEEFQLCVSQCIAQIISFKDDQGEPMNEGATAFNVMVPTTLMGVAYNALTTMGQVAASQTALEGLKKDFSIGVTVNPRLTWTTKAMVSRTDSAVKSFIRQEETAVNFAVKGDESDFAFDNDAWQAGVDSWRGVNYGYWQNSCLFTMG